MAAPQVVVEIGADAEKVVEARFTRRMLQIELGDLPLGDADAAGAPLFFRLVSSDPNTLAVELWDHGELLGRRTISISRGNPQLHSRRIALAAVELARRAPSQRLARAQRDARAEERCQLAEAASIRAARQPRLRIDTTFGGYSLGLGDGWLAGAALAAGVHGAWGGSFTARFGGYQGRQRRAGGEPYLRWYEAGVAPAYGGSLDPNWHLSAALPVSYATVFVAGAPVLDGVEGQRVTWSARAGVAPALARRLDEALWLVVSPELGWTLRNIGLRDDGGASHDLGGIWLGASVGVSVGSRH